MERFRRFRRTEKVIKSDVGSLRWWLTLVAKVDTTNVDTDVTPENTRNAKLTRQKLFLPR